MLTPIPPTGGTEVTACQFEYVDQSEFEAHKFVGATTASCSSTHFSSPERPQRPHHRPHPQADLPLPPLRIQLPGNGGKAKKRPSPHPPTSSRHPSAPPPPPPRTPIRSPAPSDVAVDDSSGPSAGDIYVTDTGNHRVEKFSPSGEFLLMFGKEVNATNHSGRSPPPNRTDDCQPGTSATAPGALASPTLISVDPSSGEVYVYDSADAVVSKFQPRRRNRRFLAIRRPAPDP